MFEAHQTEMLFRGAVGVLSLLAAAHYAVHCPDELHSLLKKHRNALSGPRVRRLIARLALMTGLTVSLSLPILYVLHGLEALAANGMTLV